MQKKDKNILDKYIQNQASVDEQARVENMLGSGEVVGVKDYIKADWYKSVETTEVIDKDLDFVLDKVHHRIHLNDSVKKIAISRRIYRWYSTAAAVILIPLMVLGALSVFKLGEVTQLLSEKASIVTISSPMGVRTAFVLPDGSKVTLNGGSTAKYAVPFTNKRDIKLNGEAYFDVTHDENHPFVVSTRDIDIRVLGTRFNVNAFDEDKFSEVILEQGKVKCNIGNNEVVMQPNERVVLKDRKYAKTMVDAAKYTAWREGKLVFRGDAMDEVAKRISRWYNVDVEVKGAELDRYSFRATFQDDSLDEVLRLLKLSSPIEYKVIGRKKQADGSFSKKKVLIYKKKIK